MCACLLNCFSHTQLFADPGTVAHQALLSVEFSGENTGVVFVPSSRIFPALRSDLQLLQLLHCRPVLTAEPLGVPAHGYGICRYFCRIKLLPGALMLEWLLRTVLSPTEPTHPIIMTSKSVG